MNSTRIVREIIGLARSPVLQPNRSATQRRREFTGEFG
jgi:hypothetical protein